MDLEQLADRVFATTDSPDRAQKCNYYMFSINHPVIAALKDRFCEKNNIRKNIPMSDRERTLFELQLLNGGVLKEIVKFCEQDEARRAKEKPEHLENSIKEE